jgi:uncharacterized protein YbaA (DUF1428 family)
MIEVRFDAGRLKKIVNDVNHHAQVTTLLKKLGVPVVGLLWLRTVSSGVLTMHTEEDIDDDEYVWRWYTSAEFTDLTTGRLAAMPRMTQRGSGDGFNWKRIDFNLNPVDDDEI